MDKGFMKTVHQVDLDPDEADDMALGELVERARLEGGFLHIEVRVIAAESGF